MRQISTLRRPALDIYVYLLASFIAFLAAGNSYAQQIEGVTPEVEISVGHDNNIFRTPEAFSDSVINISPKLQLTELYGKFALDAQYSGSYNLYSDYDQLDYQDHILSIAAKTKHLSKLSSEVLVSYKDVIEQPGSTNAITTETTEFNQTTEGRVFISGAYGTINSIGQIVISFDKKIQTFKNNEQSFRDFDSSKVTSTFFYRAAPKTRILLEASSAKLNYDNTETFDLSSTQNGLLTGVEWTATAKTTSIFKIGYQDVDYENDEIEDIQGLSYFLDMYWKPNTYSTLRVGASRAVRESAEQSVGGFVSTQYGLGIAHEFTSVTKLEANLSFIEDEITSNGDRKDESTELSLKLIYTPKHWLNVFAGFDLNKRDSNFEIYNFDANIYRIGVIASFD